MQKWTKKEISALFELPFLDLVYKAKSLDKSFN